jgi:predicted nuclease of predicted toxin-antitoxin system
LIRLLLDEHLAKAVARQLRANGYDVVSLSEWHDGNYRTAPDEQILAAAHADNRVLVTRDVKSIPGRLKDWVEIGRPHAGVILINWKSVQSRDVGGLLRALTDLLKECGNDDWTSRSHFLNHRKW